MEQSITQLEKAVPLSPFKEILEERGYMSYFRLWIGLFSFLPFIGQVIDYFYDCPFFFEVTSPCFISLLFCSVVSLIIIEGVLFFSSEETIFLKIHVKQNEVDSYYQEKLVKLIEKEKLTYDLYDFYEKTKQKEFSKWFYNIDKKITIPLMLSILSIYLAIQSILMVGLGAPEINESKNAIFETITWTVFGFVILKYIFIYISDYCKYRNGFLRYKVISRFLERNIK